MAAAAFAAPVLIAVLLVAAAAGARVPVQLQHTTILSDGGGVIDCVDIHQQPAFKDAPPGSRRIQAKPERSMKAMAAEFGASKPQQRSQTWRKHGRSCPAGTVAIRRANPEAAELARRASPFGRRPAGTTGGGSSLSSNLAATGMDTPTGKVEVAAAYATNGPYLGARADVPYWRVDVHPDEFSMNYILIGHTLDTDYVPSPGATPPADLTNQIAVGLVAWPSLYGDSLSRLFVYYTADGGAQQNCFNLDCGGFHVQQSDFVLGDGWPDSDSQVGGERYYVTMGIHRDAATELWWVTVNDEAIGYYPETVFNTRFPEAVYVEMGGRVLDTRPGGNHTATPMGSGAPACVGTRFAAGVASDGTLFNDAVGSTVVTTPGCYDARPLGAGTARPGYNTAYGGPGGIFCDRHE